MSDENEWVIVGRFGRPHGLKGYVSVYSFTDPASNILSYPDWAIKMDGQWCPLKIVNTAQHTRFITALFEGYADRDKAAQLTNLEIAVKLAHLPAAESGEFYWHQLVGMSVVNTDGVVLGVVSELLATGSNDVLVVTGEARYLIPYRPGAVILDVSEEKRQITVDWDADFL